MKQQQHSQCVNFTRMITGDRINWCLMKANEHFCRYVDIIGDVIDWEDYLGILGIMSMVV